MNLNGLPDNMPPPRFIDTIGPLVAGVKTELLTLMVGQLFINNVHPDDRRLLAARFRQSADQISSQHFANIRHQFGLVQGLSDAETKAREVIDSIITNTLGVPSDSPPRDDLRIVTE